MGDRRLETRGKRRETGDGRRGTRDERQEMEDRRWETEETGDRRQGQETGTGDEIHETGRETVDRTVVPETENRRQEMGWLTGDRTGDRRGETGNRTGETRQGRQDSGTGDSRLCTKMGLGDGG